MGIKRLIRKKILGGAGGLIEGHISDALQKKSQTGKSFRECLVESVKETIAEDLPGTSHIYEMGKIDGQIQGTAEQAARDEKKMEDIYQKHENDRKRWKKQKQAYEELLDDMENE